MESEFCIVVATGRPSLKALLATMGGRGSNAVSTTTFDVSTNAVAGASRAVMKASVALVDGSIDSAEALDVCRELQARRADLRIGVFFCCPHAATAESLRHFLDAGIGSFLDLQLSAAQMLAALRGIARGEDVVRLQLSKDSSGALFHNDQNGHDQFSAEDRDLLNLVAQGLTDHEIGAQMCLSHHTIKHRIERLRRPLHARNRIQLAAIAGRLEGAQSSGRR